MTVVTDEALMAKMDELLTEREQCRAVLREASIATTAVSADTATLEAKKWANVCSGRRRRDASRSEGSSMTLVVE